MTNKKPFSLKFLKLTLAVWWWGLIAGGFVGAALFATGVAEGSYPQITGYASDLDTSAMTAQYDDGEELVVKFDEPARVRFLLSDENGVGQRVVIHRVYSVATHRGFVRSDC